MKASLLASTGHKYEHRTASKKFQIRVRKNLNFNYTFTEAELEPRTSYTAAALVTTKPVRQFLPNLK